jgi:hypothetical protein
MAYPELVAKKRRNHKRYIILDDELDYVEGVKEYLLCDEDRFLETIKSRRIKDEVVVMIKQLVNQRIKELKKDRSPTGLALLGENQAMLAQIQLLEEGKTFKKGEWK